MSSDKEIVEVQIYEGSGARGVTIPTLTRDAPHHDGPPSPPLPPPAHNLSRDTTVSSSRSSPVNTGLQAPGYNGGHQMQQAQPYTPTVSLPSPTLPPTSSLQRTTVTNSYGYGESQYPKPLPSAPRPTYPQQRTASSVTAANQPLQSRPLSQGSMEKSQFDESPPSAYERCPNPCCNPQASARVGFGGGGGLRNGNSGGGGGGRGGGGNPTGEESADSDGDGESIGDHAPVKDRIKEVKDAAEKKRKIFETNARRLGFYLTLAIALQVIINALVTALSAITSGRGTSIMTSVLGGIGTVVASYLARARGSGEPEFSTAKEKELERFIRTCDALIKDHGDETGCNQDHKIFALRQEFEILLGNGSEKKMGNDPPPQSGMSPQGYKRA